MVTGFNHSGFVVKDIERMVAFYKDVLGLSIIREVESNAPPDGDHTGIPGAKRVLVFVGWEDAEHVLELVYFVDPPSPDGHLERNQLGAAHICFNVDNLTDLHNNLSNKGVEFVTGPKFRDTPDGGMQGVCYGRDPEGNWLEFIERRPGK